MTRMASAEGFRDRFRVAARIGDIHLSHQVQFSGLGEERVAQFQFADVLAAAGDVSVKLVVVGYQRKQEIPGTTQPYGSG